MIIFSKPSDEYGFLCPDSREGFVYNGWHFDTIHKFLAYSKAKTFGDLRAAYEILTQQSIGMMQRLAREAAGVNETRWEGQMPAVLFRGLTAFFEDHPEYVTKLVETGDEWLVYCDDDKVLGNGIYSFHKDEAEDPANWTGKNLLGFTLMEVREVYRAKMPGVYDTIPKNLPGIIMHRAENGYLGFPPYEGTEPYLYLNYSVPNTENAEKLGNMLFKAGCRVWYDEKLGGGRLWTGKRSDAIAGCTGVVTLYNGSETFSHAELAAIRFAELLGIPILMVDTASETPNDRDKYYENRTYVYGKLYEEDFAEKLSGGLARLRELAEKAGPDLPAADEDEGSAAADAADSEYGKKSRKSYDLGFRYYENYRRKRKYRGYDYECNLRTREVYDEDGARVHNLRSWTEYGRGRVTEDEGPKFLGDEETYRFMMWLRDEFVLVPKNAERDYTGLPSDWEYAKHLAALTAHPDPEIAAEFKKQKKEYEESLSGYPYKDEFEYLNTLYDD